MSLLRGFLIVAAMFVAACGDLLPSPPPVTPAPDPPIVRPLWRSTMIAGGNEGWITTIGDLVLVPNSGRLRLVNPATGTQVWASDSGNPRIGFVWNSFLTPSEFVVVDQGVAVFAWNPTQLRWWLPLDTWQAFGDRGATAALVRGDAVFVTTGAGVVERRAVSSGTLVWRTIVPGPCVRNCRLRGIVSVGDTLWIVGDRFAENLSTTAALLALDATTGAVLWDGASLGLGGLGPAAAVRDSLLIVHGQSSAQLAAINLRTRRVQWLVQMRPAGPTDFKIEGETIYVSSAEARVYAVALATGTVRWMMPVNGSQFSIQLCGDYVVSNGFALHWLDKRTGRFVASAYADDGSEMHEGFAVVGDRVIAQTDRTVYAFPCRP